MYKSKWIFSGVAIAITASMFLVNAARSQSIPNLSDITGTNNFSAPPTPDSFSGENSSPTPPAVIQQNAAEASSISNELNDALSSQSEASAKEPPKAPRHFARKPSENCVNPSVAKAERLNETVGKAQNFLNEVNQNQPNSGSNSPW
jgi:methylmalonyl-CoA mutase N-terminal domain/subunit